MYIYIQYTNEFIWNLLTWQLKYYKETQILEPYIYNQKFKGKLDSFKLSQA